MATNHMANRAVLPADRGDFQIGIITALDLETEAVIRLFEESFDTNGYSYGKHALDDNSYSTGRIAGKLVVLCQLASIGKLEASITAQHMQLSFSNIEILLLVGVAGGNPWTLDGQPILLGDVALSTRVVEIDSGRLHDEGIEPRKGAEHELTKSHRRVRNFLARLRSPSKRSWVASQVDKLTTIESLPGRGFDILYDSSYIHKHRTVACDVCQSQKDVTCEAAKLSTCQELQCQRLADTDNKPMAFVRESVDSMNQSRKCKIHFGIVASGGMVVKSALHRDRFCKSIPGIVAFEMEASGIWETFPTIVVKGICDYADAHKDKRWQPFAAARAAACAQILVTEWVLTEKTSALTSSNKLCNEHWMPCPSRVPVKHFVGYRKILERLNLRLPDHLIQQQIIFVLSGMGGIGKSEVVLQFLQNPKIREVYWAVFWVDCTTEDSAQACFNSIGRAIGLENHSMQDVKRHLGSGSRLTLLILDNCDDPAVDYSNKYIPFASHVRIILIGRTQECERYASHDSRGITDYEYIEGLDIQASSELILVLSKDQSPQSINHDAADLAKVLGNHPLAIRVACSCIRTYAFTISECIAQFGETKNQPRYEQHYLVRSLLLDSASGDAQYDNIFNTFNISISKFSGNKKDPVAKWAIALLDFAACVDRTEISLDIFLRAWLFEDKIEKRAPDSISLGLTNRHVILCRMFGEDSTVYEDAYSCHCPAPPFWSQKRIRKHDMATIDKLRTPQTQVQSAGDDLLGSTSYEATIENRRRCLQQGMARLCEAELAMWIERGRTIAFHPVVHTWAKLRLNMERSKTRALAISGSILALAVGDAVDWHPRSSYLRKHLEAYLMNDHWDMRSTTIAPPVPLRDRSLIGKIGDSSFIDELRDWSMIEKCRAHMVLMYPLVHTRSSVVVENLCKMIDTLEILPQQIVRQLLCFRAKELLYVSMPKDDPKKIELQKTVIASIVPDTDDMAHNLLVAQRNLADTFLDTGRTREAIQYLENLIKHYPIEDWDYDRDLLALQDLLGIAFRVNGELTRAEDVLRKVVQKREEFEKEDDQLLCSSKTYLADVYNDKLDFTSALSIMERTLEVMCSSRDKNDHFLLLSQQTAAKAYFGSGDREQGIKIMTEVNNIRMSVYGLRQEETIEATECLKIMQCKDKPQDAGANKRHRR